MLFGSRLASGCTRWVPARWWQWNSRLYLQWNCVFKIFYPDSIMSYPSFTVDELMRSWHSLRICSTDIEEICSVTVRFVYVLWGYVLIMLQWSWYKWSCFLGWFKLAGSSSNVWRRNCHNFHNEVHKHELVCLLLGTCDHMITWPHNKGCGGFAKGR